MRLRPVTVFTVPFLLFLFSISVVPVRAQLKNFTLEQILGRGVNLGGFGRGGAVQWLPDGEHYLRPIQNGAEAVDARTGTALPFASDDPATAFAKLPEFKTADAAGQVADRARFAQFIGAKYAIAPYKNDLYVYGAATKTAYRATRTPETPKDNATVSPDGQTVAFIKRDNNLYVADVMTATEHQLTFDGNLKTRNGKLDWVYEEEVYGRGDSTGYRWSADGSKIAFLRLDETPVKDFPIIDHLTSPQTTEIWNYPKAGDPNPIVTLGIASTDGKSPIKFVDLSKYPENDRLIVRFGFTPDSKKLIFQAQNRIQKWLDMDVADPSTGKTTTLFRETATAWIEAGPEPRFLKDGTFLWESGRTGFNHLYRYKPDGTLIGAITKGEWDVKRIAGIDQAKGIVYFDATVRNPIGSDFYKANLDGTGEPIRLTEKIGTHQVRLNPTFTMFVDNFSSHETPNETTICETEKGSVIRRLEKLAAADIPAAKEYRLGKVKTVKVPMRDGYVLDGALLLPPDYDPNKRYPVFCPVYAGPASPQLRDAWRSLSGDLYNQFIAQHGIIVWQFDNRTASGRGIASTSVLYKHFGESELRDIEDGINFLVEKGYADKARIAISGWSFGGFMTQYALTHSKMFKVGIAGAGVADWRLYDSIYTERYMDTPQNNPEGYKASSNIEAAANLSGKLLLLHGTMDDNVHMQNTIQLIFALEKADKPFDLMIYPESRHGINAALQKHLRTLQTKYLLENL